MSTFYSSLAATANRILTSKGQSVTVTRNSGATYDPSTSSAAPSGSPEIGVGAFLNYGKGQPSHGGDGLVQVGAKKLVLSASGMTGPLAPGDKVEALDELGANQVWSVASCDSLAPDGTPVIYICQVTRA